MKLLSFVMLAALPCGAQQLRLTFEGHGEHTFAAGYVIHVPDTWTVTGIRVEAQGDPDDTFTLQLDGRFLARGSVKSGVKASTEEPAGYLRAELHALKLLKGLTGVTEWTVLREKQSHIVAEHSTDAAPAPDVRIDEPPLKMIRQPGPEVRIEGSVVSGGEFSVKVAGKSIERDVTRDGWGFAAKIPLAANVDSVEILVEDRRGSARRLVLPVYR
jgi:hypothetical protein